MHGTQHASCKLVNVVALLDKRDKSRNSALVVGCRAEIGKDKFLELVDLVLKIHQVVNSLVTRNSIR